MSQDTSHGNDAIRAARAPGLLARLAARFRRGGDAPDERPYDPELDVDRHLGLAVDVTDPDSVAGEDGPEAEADGTASARHRTLLDMLLRRPVPADAEDEPEDEPEDGLEDGEGPSATQGGTDGPLPEPEVPAGDPRAAIVSMLHARSLALSGEADADGAGRAETAPSLLPAPEPDGEGEPGANAARKRIVALVAQAPGRPADAEPAPEGSEDVIVEVSPEPQEAAVADGGVATQDEAERPAPSPAPAEESGFVEDEDTSRALVLRADGTRLPRHRLGEYVLNRGLINAEALDAASREQEVTGKRIGQILVANGFLSDRDRVEAILETSSERIAQENVARTRIPVDELDEYNIQVSAETEDCIYVSTMGDEETVRRIVESYYGDKRVEFVSFQPTSMNAFIGAMKKTASTDDAGQSAETMLDRMLFKALQDGASDVHLMPRRESYTVMFRLLGVRRIVHEGTLEEYKIVIAQVKDRARMDLAERRKPQDGGFQIEYAGKMIDLRVATLPTAEGETCVLRVLDPDRVQPSLDRLGITRLDRWRKGVSQQHGLCVVCGPTGSGKTTTMNSSIKEMDRFGKAIYTIEDPVEYRIPYAGQVSVNSSVGLNFPAAVRAFMRADPDVIVLGEVRDEETARNAIKAADTGHLVLATLHTGSILGAVSRLRDLGIDPRELRYLLRAVLVQTLVRTTCDGCGGAGCASCGGTGYSGRTLVSECEYFEDYEAVDRLLKATGDSDVKRTWPTMLEDAVGKMRQGVTDRRELERVFGAAVEMHLREGE